MKKNNRNSVAFGYGAKLGQQDAYPFKIGGYKFERVNKMTKLGALQDDRLTLVNMYHSYTPWLPQN